VIAIRRVPSLVRIEGVRSYLYNVPYLEFLVKGRNECAAATVFRTFSLVPRRQMTAWTGLTRALV